MDYGNKVVIEEVVGKKFNMMIDGVQIKNIRNLEYTTGACELPNLILEFTPSETNIALNND